MASYFFILGRNPTLSYFEIVSYLKTHNLVYTVVLLTSEVLIIDSQVEINLRSIVDFLGGTVKSGKIIKKINYTEALGSWERLFNFDFLRRNFIRDQIGKLHFGVSLYVGGADDKIMHALSYELRNIQKIIRVVLKEGKISSGFVQSNERVLPTATVLYNKLLTKGFEMILIPSNDTLIIGLTETIQDFNAFSFRDMKRPVRDKRSGIIPPKLARMMIHFTGCNSNSVFLDPFCGSGTILMEAMVLGIHTIIGRDISLKAVSDSKKNTSWIKDIEKDRVKNISVDIRQSDIRSISEIIKDGSVDCIATEPFLGENTHLKLTLTQIYSRFDHLKPLYVTMFEKFSRVLKVGGMVSVILPAFFDREKMILCPFYSKALEYNLRPIQMIFPSEIKTIGMTDRGTFIYGTKDDFTAREICVFTKQ